MPDETATLDAEAKAVKLMEKIVNQCYGGMIPEDATRLVAACILVFVPENTADEVSSCFALSLVQALDLLRRQQNCQWVN